MKQRFAKRMGGTGFQPVQFGILPNGLAVHEFVLAHARPSSSRISPVSGRMPETTGRKPVPPGEIEISCHA